MVGLNTMTNADAHYKLKKCLYIEAGTGIYFHILDFFSETTNRWPFILYQNIIQIYAINKSCCNSTSIFWLKFEDGQNVKKDFVTTHLTTP